MPNVGWLNDWGATVTLDLSVDEQAAVNPGVSVIQPLENAIKTFPVGGNVTAAQVFNLGIGVTGSAHTTRLETITFTLSNKQLLAEAQKDIARGDLSCEGLRNGVLIEGDLKIGQFIYDKAVIAGFGEAATKAPTSPPFTTLQEKLTFVASYGGNVTPTWKFLRTTVDQNGNLLTATRGSTNDVLISLGPVAKPATPTAQAKLSQATELAHYSSYTGGSTASSIQAQTR